MAGDRQLPLGEALRRGREPRAFSGPPRGTGSTRSWAQVETDPFGYSWRMSGDEGQRPDWDITARLTSSDELEILLGTEPAEGVAQQVNLDADGNSLSLWLDMESKLFAITIRNASQAIPSETLKGAGLDCQLTEAGNLIVGLFPGAFEIRRRVHRLEVENAPTVSVFTTRGHRICAFAILYAAGAIAGSPEWAHL